MIDHIFELRRKIWDMIDHRSHTHNLSSREIKAWKIRPQRDSNLAGHIVSSIVIYLSPQFRYMIYYIFIYILHFLRVYHQWAPTWPSFPEMYSTGTSLQYRLNRGILCTYYLLILIGPMRTLEAGQKIAPSIPVCRRCSSSLPRMPSQLVAFLLHGSSPWFFSTFLSAGLVSFYLQVPTSVQSSRCCQDLSSKRVRSISIFSLVWGLISAYSLLFRRALCCSDGWARISSVLSSGMCGETHLVCWDQLLSLSTFRLHTVVRPAHLNLGCAAWSSGWIFLTPDVLESGECNSG